MTWNDGTGQLRADSARITELIATDLDVPVPSCPGWSLRDLVVHLGGVHRWARDAVVTGAAPERASAVDTPTEDPAPDEADALARWFGDGLLGVAAVQGRLVGLAADPDPDGGGLDRERGPGRGVRVRRQTHETSLHRRDAEEAVAAARPIDPTLAADGVDEYLSVIVPRLVQRDGLHLPSGSAHLHCTDTSGEWTVEVVDGDYVIDRAHRKGDAAIRAAAEPLLLRLWGRDVPDGAFDVFGDEGVAAAWLGLGGN